MTLAAEIQRAQAAERRKLADIVAGWRFEAIRRPRTVWSLARRRRGPVRRPAARSAPRNGQSRGDSDPHIDGAPPVAVATHGGAEVAHV